MIIRLSEAAPVAVVLVLAFVLALQPALADDAPCKWTIDETITQLTEPFRVVDRPEDVAKGVADLRDAGVAVPDGVTRILLAILQGQGFYGLEVDGCLSAPAPLPGAVPALPAGVPA